MPQHKTKLDFIRATCTKIVGNHNKVGSNCRTTRARLSRDLNTFLSNMETRGTDNGIVDSRVICDMTNNPNECKSMKVDITYWDTINGKFERITFSYELMFNTTFEDDDHLYYSINRDQNEMIDEIDHDINFDRAMRGI